MKGTLYGVVVSAGALLLGIVCIMGGVASSNLTLLMRASVVLAVGVKLSIWPPVAGAAYDILSAVVYRIRGAA